MNLIYEGEGKPFPVLVKLTVEEAKALLKLLESFVNNCEGEEVMTLAKTLLVSLRELRSFMNGESPSQRER